MTENIYPDFGLRPHERSDLQPSAPLLYDNVSDRINKNLSDARIKEIQIKRNELENNLKHYRKILKRWKQFGNFLKYTSLIIVTGTGITSMVLGFGTFAIPMVFGILAAVGATESVIFGGLTFGLVKKKVEKFKKKIEHIQNYISKSWYLLEKIRQDSIITLDEINEFRKLMEEYEKGLQVSQNEEEDSFLKLRESLKHQAEKEAKEEVKKDLISEMKSDLKQKILQK